MTANSTVLPFAIERSCQFLLLTFPQPQQILSWTITQPGFHITRRVAWIELRNADLPVGVSAEDVVASRLAAHHADDVPAMVTSRDITQLHVKKVDVEGQVAVCVTTVGLSNGERVGQRSRAPVVIPGTINTLVHVSRRLTQAAQVEAIAMIAAAKTTAIIDSGVRRDGIAITGTGTDCILVASPAQGPEERFAGMHTALGEAMGAAVYEATREGVEVWTRDYASMLNALVSS